MRFVTSLNAPAGIEDEGVHAPEAKGLATAIRFMLALTLAQT